MFNAHEQGLISQIRSYWSDSLVTFEERTLSGLSLGVSSQQYLRDVGVPQLVDDQFFFCGEFAVLSARVVFAKAWDGPLLIPHQNSVVKALDPQLTRERFANSSLPGFFACLIAYLDYCSKAGDLEEDEEEIASLISNTQGRMKYADPSAWSSEENYWAAIVEQMEAGLL